MSRSRRGVAGWWAGAAVTVFAAAACGGDPAPPDGAERRVLEAELAEVSDSFQAAIEGLDADAYLSVLASPDELRFTRDGQVVTTLHDEARTQFGAVESMNCDWPDRHIMVLAAGAGTVTTTYRCAGRNRDGVEWEGAGAWTNIFQKRGEDWIVIEAHESHLPPTLQ